MSSADPRRLAGAAAAAETAARRRAFAPLVQIPEDLHVTDVIDGDVMLSSVLAAGTSWRPDADVSLVAALPTGKLLIDVVDEAAKEADVTEDGTVVDGVRGDARVREVIPRSVLLFDVISPDSELTGLSKRVGDVVDENTKLIDVLPDTRVADLMPGARVLDVLPPAGERVSPAQIWPDSGSFRFEH